MNANEIPKRAKKKKKKWKRKIIPILWCVNRTINVHIKQILFVFHENIFGIKKKKKIATVLF
jgi:hypothetical protein